MNIIALMSGSSLDGLDIALICIHEVDGQLDWKIQVSDTLDYDLEMVQVLSTMPSMSAVDYVTSKANYSIWVSSQVTSFIQKYDLEVDLISWHGHTIFHWPEKNVSIQIGDGGIMAAKAGIPCLTDFRITDIALGGQGTPLAPIVEKVLFSDYDLYLNIGGIANISNHNNGKILAWDVCPANQLTNYLSKKLGKEYDSNGDFARKGDVDQNLLKKLSDFDFYQWEPPKSLDNNWIRTSYFSLLDDSSSSIYDKLATVNQFVVERIIHDLKSIKNVPDSDLKLLVSGGGTHNGYFIELLKNALREINIELVIPDQEVIDFKETILMALLGYLRINKKTNVLSSVTGASRDSIGGALYIP